MSKLENSIDYINQVTYDFNDYEELDEMGRIYLLDEIIDVMEDLKIRDTPEGRFYIEMVQLVKKGEQIPQPFTEIQVAAAISGETYTVKVKIITELKWKSDGDLLVSFLGVKVKN